MIVLQKGAVRREEPRSIVRDKCSTILVLFKIVTFERFLSATNISDQQLSPDHEFNPN